MVRGMFIPEDSTFPRARENRPASLGTDFLWKGKREYSWSDSLVQMLMPKEWRRLENLRKARRERILNERARPDPADNSAPVATATPSRSTTAASADEDGDGAPAPEETAADPPEPSTNSADDENQSANEPTSNGDSGAGETHRNMGATSDGESGKFGSHHCHETSPSREPEGDADPADEEAFPNEDPERTTRVEGAIPNNGFPESPPNSLSPPYIPSPHPSQYPISTPPPADDAQPLNPLNAAAHYAQTSLVLPETEPPQPPEASNLPSWYPSVEATWRWPDQPSTVQYITIPDPGAP